MEYLHFRVHTDELELNDLVTFLHEQTDVQFIVKEFGKSNREHIHSCLVLKCPKQTFVDRMKKKFQVIKGNKYYAIQKLKKDYDTNARYCYKGTPNDYPDIIYTVHTEDQWKAYYKAYWEEFSLLKAKSNEGNMGSQIKDTSFTKAKSKTFMEKLNERVHDEHEELVINLWKHYGYKSDVGGIDKDTLECIQDRLSEILLLSLGKARKNIDDMIFERMYRNLYYGLLADCPKNLLEAKSKEFVSKFRHKL